MRNILKFQSELEFQSFFSQLTSAEMENFMSVDGSNGDYGFDGISDDIAFQAYFPEIHNRKDKKYIAKINEDLEKVLKNKLKVPVRKWILVVPEDLRMPVISHLIKKSRATGMILTYWGATKLTELVSKHPHVIESFPLIFMPSVKSDIKEIKGLIKKDGKKVSLDNIEILGDEDFSQEIKKIEREYMPKIDSFPRRPDGSLYHPLKEDLDYISEMELKTSELASKKRKSDRAYELELEELVRFYTKQLEKAEEDFIERGLSSSGMKYRAIGEILSQRAREIEKLKLKYGITEMNLSNFLDQNLLSKEHK